MSDLYPSLSEAEKLFEEIISIRNTSPHPFKPEWEKEFRIHSHSVACLAEKIASKTAYLNSEKAYVLGLLHDSGRLKDEFAELRYHSVIGYHWLKSLGWEDAARISITHCFYDKNFKVEDYPQPRPDVQFCREYIDTIEFDDYDRLLQLCDILNDCGRFCTIEQRFESLSRRYKTAAYRQSDKIDALKKIKVYFDKKCHCDIYELAGIESDNGYPSVEEAEKIWQNGIDYRERLNQTFLDKPKYINHSRGVAIAAQKIASATPYLNSEKAYILGLLHDYGKRISEMKDDRFHGQEGYEEMMKMGYPSVARICLTHSFPDQNIKNEDTNYRSHWINWARTKFQEIEYDDYDRLIQLCDMIVDDTGFISIEQRIALITERYGMNAEQQQRLLDRVLPLKRYFDQKCGKNVYEILEVVFE